MRHAVLRLVTSTMLGAMLLVGYLWAAPASAQEASATETEPGIPVTNSLVRDKCGNCHTVDQKGDMARISWIRTTPEGWERAIKRMVRLNDLKIAPQDAKAIVKALSARHGLAPEEAKPVMYMPEHRIQDETNIPNDTVRSACATCHAFGQPLSWRRSKEEWSLLANLHVALYQQAERFIDMPASGVPAGPQGRRETQGQIALEYLVKTAPLHTPEWAAWQSRMQTPHLEGRWLVTASALGQGRFVGEMVIEPGAAADEFKTSVTLRSLKTGATLKRVGAGILYTGYSWRGRSNGQVPAAMHPGTVSTDAREALWFSPDQATAQGRWFWGAYQEFGFDVKLTRISTAPVVAMVDPYALKAGSQRIQLKILGANLPTSLQAADLHLGNGVSINRIVSQNGDEMVADVDVAPDASSGLRDVQLGGAALENGFVVYHRIDYIKVIPDGTVARLGSVTHPRGYQQFDAIGYENGPDGKPHTADDLRLGPVDATWQLKEFITSYNDDDTKYVGSLGPQGLFIPGSDGPDPARRFGRNNYGDVWVTATDKDAKDQFGKPLTGRAYLVVAVPMYERWDQPEVSEVTPEPRENTQ